MRKPPQKTTPTASTNDPVRETAGQREMFNKAIARMHPSAQCPGKSQTPIGLRQQIEMQSDSTVEKHAVSEAARALARLWKVSPSLVR
ncbi:MAG TPA: hypothetical protein VMG31_02825 [Verrucomicrobiae bacterium]|nr:hypothetical protein [Verrucomicrobiae bacterium]